MVLPQLNGPKFSANVAKYRIILITIPTLFHSYWIASKSKSIILVNYSLSFVRKLILR